MRLFRSVAAILAVGSVIALFVAAGAGEDGMLKVGGAGGRVFERGPAILGSIILGIGSVLVYLGITKVAVDYDRQVSDGRSYWMLASGIVLWGVTLVMFFSFGETTRFELPENFQLPNSMTTDSWSAGKCVAIAGELAEPTECGPLANGYISTVVADESQCPDTTVWAVDLLSGMVAASPSGRFHLRPGRLAVR